MLVPRASSAESTIGSAIAAAFNPRVVVGRDPWSTVKSGRAPRVLNKQVRGNDYDPGNEREHARKQQNVDEPKFGQRCNYEICKAAFGEGALHLSE